MDGHSLLEMKPAQLAGQVGTVFQDPRSQFFMTDTTRELAFGCENMGLPREETIDRIAKAAKDLELADYLNRSIFALSSGEKQQIAVGSVYALSPKVYIFDEPSANLDYAATKRLAEIMGKLKRDGYTIFVVEHRFYYLRDLIDRVFLIQNGKIEQEFTREQFCSLPEETRISYGLRTAYPERDAEHYQEKERRPMGEHMLSVQGLSFAYPKEQEVFRNVSFEAHAGDVIGILGHNGAGKTTTIKLLTRQLAKDSGRIHLFGRPIEHATNADYERIGILSDTSALYERMSIEDNLRFYAKIRGVTGNNIPTLLERMGLADSRKTLVKNCSKGMRQRAALLAALVHGPELLFLDEPTSGLDPAARAEVHKMLRELKDAGATVFLTTHDMAEAEDLCDRIGILNEGRLIADDAPQALKLRHARNEVVMRLASGRVVRTTKDAAGAPLVAEALASGECLSVHSVEPNLEEVFLEMAGREF